jgi:hypothetical protein
VRATFATTGLPRERPAAPRQYHVYGVTVRSAVPLACPLSATPAPAGIELSEAPPSLFRETVPDADTTQEKRWFRHTALPDGTDYLRWSKLFEFLISPDGRRVACHALNGVSSETFQTYLVSQTLSCALLKQGIESLHATVVVVRGQAVAFLGDCGYGKSSLGAAFLRAGHAILTDDMLVLDMPGRHRPAVVAHPGPPRIKLFPKIAHTFLGSRRKGARMNPGTTKLIIPLSAREHCGQAVPLRALYVLRPPAARRAPKHVAIRSLTRRAACLALIANTFNTIITDPARLARQFAWAARLAGAVPVKSLSYPRRLTHIPAVLAAIQKDLAR